MFTENNKDREMGHINVKKFFANRMPGHEIKL